MNWWWKKHSFLKLFFLPLSCIYLLVIKYRDKLYKKKLLTSFQSPVPVIVVGNITVGGNGKTPFVIALVKYLTKHGYRPGIVSRGYGGKAKHYPQKVTGRSQVHETGDEPLLLMKQLGCPVYIDPVRPRAIQHLLNNEYVNIIVSDDGLQHYAMQRDIEIVMVDGERLFGNHCVLPAGPLREPIVRLKHADYVVSTGNIDNDWLTPWKMTLKPLYWVNCKNVSLTLPVDAFVNQTVDAIASIGHPNRFFDQLKKLGMQINCKAFADHYPFNDNDLHEFKGKKLVMTAKDAVKLMSCVEEDWWYLAIEPIINEELLASINRLIQDIRLK